MKLLAVPKLLRAAWQEVATPDRSAASFASPIYWVTEARKRFDSLPERTKSLLDHHELTPSNHQIVFFGRDLEKTAGPKLAAMASRPMTPELLAEAIDEIVRWKTIAQCAYSHKAREYFDDAEPYMEKQWETIIWPIIRDEDFTTVLELACGHGRNTNFLRRHASSIDLIDVNEHCVEACRQRFGSELENCKFRYHLTAGNGLPMISSGSITFGYSWDSMVHFDKLVVRDYVVEFARVLRPGGTAFLHHSNYGAIAPDSDWANNHGSRSDMTAALMRQYAEEAGLEIKFQRLSGKVDGWGMDDLDCLSLLRKPA
jgi:ubiquinone/menaquinone biosynthesis C-methylase UbiE